MCVCLNISRIVWNGYIARLINVSLNHNLSDLWKLGRELSNKKYEEKK